MRLRNSIWGISLIVFLLLGCKEKNTSPEEIIVELPSEFAEFYERFHSDSAYQVDHIIFPLEGKISESGDQEKWAKEKWTIHKEFGSGFTDYQRDYSVMEGIVIEKIFDRYGMFYLERRFSKVVNDWNLIYYSVEYNEPPLDMN